MRHSFAHVIIVLIKAIYNSVHNTITFAAILSIPDDLQTCFDMAQITPPKYACRVVDAPELRHPT